MLDKRIRVVDNLSRLRHGLSIPKTMARTWIRVATAAKLKGVRRQTIYYHIKLGNLISMDMDGNTYVDRDEVLALKPRGKGEYQKRTKKAKTEVAARPPDLGQTLALP